MDGTYQMLHDIIDFHNDRMRNLRRYYPFFCLQNTAFHLFKEGKYAFLDMGYITLAAVVTVVVGIVYFALNFFQFGVRRCETKQLRITVPENLNFNGAFDDLFREYATSVELGQIKTTNLGTLYELTYSIDMKKNVDEKAFIDSLRCRNGNLNIILCKMPETLEKL
jgi:hypothetical protein